MKNLEYKVNYIPKKCECGHTVNFIKRKKQICKWCGRMVYFDEKERFKEKMKNILGKGKNDK